MPSGIKSAIGPRPHRLKSFLELLLKPNMFCCPPTGLLMYQGSPLILCLDLLGLRDIGQHFAALFLPGVFLSGSDPSTLHRHGLSRLDSSGLQWIFGSARVVVLLHSCPQHLLVPLTAACRSVLLHQHPGVCTSICRQTYPFPWKKTLCSMALHQRCETFAPCCLAWCLL